MLATRPRPAVPAGETGWRQARAYHDAPDAALIRRSAEGDRRAFEVLITRYRADLVGFCRRHFRDRHDQDELLQESMIKAWRRIDQFDGRSSVRTWLYRIVANAAVDEYRRQVRTAAPIDPLLDGRAGAQESPEWAVVEREHLRWAFALLPPQYRLVSVLADKLGCSHAEIATLCDIPEATVRTRLWRARRALRVALSLPDPAV